LKSNEFDTISSYNAHIKLALGIYPNVNPKRIIKIKSKDTALKECNRYLNKNYPRAKRIECKSTAAAMQEIMRTKSRTTASIGSEHGMNLYGLKILNYDIGDKKENYTTFILIKLK